MAFSPAVDTEVAVTEPAQDTAFYLEGNFRPVDKEVTAHDLVVHGSIPTEIDGLYVRNGPNPKSGSSPHWFLGDGMLHGVQFGDGKAQWYRNRWVQTRQLNEPGASLVGSDGSVDYTVGSSNTHVVHHAGKTLALVESSFPVEVDGELGTVGPHDFGGKLKSAMTAHPKICPTTGEMHFFGYGFFEPYLTYHRVSATGELLNSEIIDVPGPTMIHDFSITENHVIFMDLPITFNLEIGMSGGMPYVWDESYGARLGVMERHGVEGRTGETRWFEIDPCYVFHVANSFESDGTVTLDVARYEHLWRDGPNDFNSDAFLHRWEIDLARGAVSSRQLDDLPTEFPRVADSHIGLANRYTYGAVLAIDRSGIIRYDLQTEQTELLDLGDSLMAAEPVPVANPRTADSPGDSSESGWLFSHVYNRAEDSSELWIVAAADVAAGPVARIEMPQRVPMGFHGSWIPTT